jgi:endonuclease/exonuclease/phosphatase (EEP) superfamily protein YafD
VETAPTAPPARRRGARPVLRALLLPLALPWVAWAALRVSGHDGGYPLPQVLAFTPYAALGALATTALAVATRQVAAAVAAGAAALVLAACVLPRTVGGPDGDGAPLRVMTVNLEFGAAYAGQVVALVAAGHVDVLALQEYTPDAQARLAAHGLDRLLPYRAAYPARSAAGSALYSRHPLTDPRLALLPGGFTQAEAVAHVPGHPPVRLVSVHPVAPAQGWQVPYWRAGLAAQPPARPGGELRLLAGDFNATLDHPRLRRLVATGYRDAASVLGRGLVPTWPFDGRRVPWVTIDHVLADARFGVRGYAVEPVGGTDHRAVLVTLAWPAKR